MDGPKPVSPTAVGSSAGFKMGKKFMALGKQTGDGSTVFLPGEPIPDSITPQHQLGNCRSPVVSNVI